MSKFEDVLIAEFGSVANSNMEYSGTIEQMRFAFQSGERAWMERAAEIVDEKIFEFSANSLLRNLVVAAIRKELKEVG